MNNWYLNAGKFIVIGFCKKMYFTFDILYGPRIMKQALGNTW